LIAVSSELEDAEASAFVDGDGWDGGGHGVEVL
jgi:hypothetical protein